MNRDTTTRKEVIEHLRNAKADKCEEESNRSQVFPNPIPNLITAAQWNQVLAALVKIIIGVILITAGYFLPH